MYNTNILCKIYLAIIFCFASLFAHLRSILINFNCNDENRILGNETTNLQTKSHKYAFVESISLRRGQ